MTPKASAIASRKRPSGSGDVIDQLRRKYDDLTHSQKRIAQFIVENPQAVAFSTIDQMAIELGVNASTIVRFTYRLGLQGFPDLQRRIRDLVKRQLHRATEPSEDTLGAPQLAGTSFGASLHHDLQNLQRTLLRANAADFDRAVEQIVLARRVYVTAGFSSFAVAHYFALILNRLRADIVLFHADDAFSAIQIDEMDAKDCVVAFTFPRYATATQRLAQWAKNKGAAVIAVTDTPISAVGQLATTVLLADSGGTGIQNSLVCPMAVANALLNGVAGAKGAEALERHARQDRILHDWHALLLMDEEDE
ncbi:MAG: MurR/RpiR family transcriptional regulator [Steroidobacteraceae bacterium]